MADDRTYGYNNGNLSTGTNGKPDTGSSGMLGVILEIAIAAVITITLVIIGWIVLRINVKRIDAKLTSHSNMLNDLATGGLMVADVYGRLLVQHGDSIEAGDASFATFSSNATTKMATDSNYLYPAISSIQQAQVTQTSKHVSMTADMNNILNGSNVFSKLKIGPATVFNDASTGFNIDAGGPIFTVSASNLRFTNSNTCVDFLGGTNIGSICGDATNNFLRFKGRNMSTESNLSVGGMLTARGGISLPYGYTGRMFETSNASGVGGMTITDGGGLRAAYGGGISLGASGVTNYKSGLEIAPLTNDVSMSGNLTIGGSLFNVGIKSDLDGMNTRMGLLSNVAIVNSQSNAVLRTDMDALNATLRALSNAVVGGFAERPIVAKV
jgi:hypothetical protein